VVLTTFYHYAEKRKVVVEINRGGRNHYKEVGTGFLSELVYEDEFVKLFRLTHPKWQTRVVGFHFYYRRKRPSFCSSAGEWWASVFYRRPDKEYNGRKWKTVVNDGHVVLIRYGKRNSDYLLVGKSPPALERKSDVRFATVPSQHPIERGYKP
jgi:hypothetical protein